MATYYIDPDNGASGNNGTSEATPKSAYSQLTVAAGDTVLFKRGTTHAGQIALTNGTDANTRTTYGAYGTGPKPILRHSASVLLRTTPAPAYLTVQNLTLWPSDTGTSVAGMRVDNPTYVTVSSCDFVGGYDGIRSDCVTSSSVFNNNKIEDCTFTDCLNCGIRIVLGTTSGADSIVGHTTQILRNEFVGVGKDVLLLGTQGANVAASRLHRYHTMTITDNYAHDCMASSPSPDDDDQCFSIKNLRETTLGNSVIARNRIVNIGRRTGGSALIVGYWFEGMTNVIVSDNVADNVMTPGGNDGGAFFLDANTAAGDEFTCTGNLFLRNVALNTNNNKAWTPYTSNQGNNSDGFTISRNASANVFASCIAVNCAVGFHVTGNCQVNYFYNCTAARCDYNWYLQTSSGDTPAGLAQVIRNCIGAHATVYDYRHGSSPKADEQYNNFMIMNGDTADATTTQVDPKFVGGTRPISADGVRLRSDSPLRREGVSYLTGAGVYSDAGGRRARLPADLGAWQRRPGD